jgi:hypothetical protein
MFNVAQVNSLNLFKMDTVGDAYIVAAWLEQTDTTPEDGGKVCKFNVCGGECVGMCVYYTYIYIYIHIYIHIYIYIYIYMYIVGGYVCVLYIYIYIHIYVEHIYVYIRGSSPIKLSVHVCV